MPQVDALGAHLPRLPDNHPRYSQTFPLCLSSLYLFPRRIFLVVNDTVITAEHWFSFVSIDVKGCLGTIAMVDIQDRIAMRVNLGIIFRLASQARHADPRTFRPPDDVMRRTYGMTVMTKNWQLYVMIAETDDDGEAGGEAGGVGENERDVLQVKSYVRV